MTKAEKFAEDFRKYEELIKEYKENEPKKPDCMEFILSWDPYSGNKNFNFRITADGTLMIDGLFIHHSFIIDSKSALKLGHWLIDVFGEENEIKSIN